MVEFKPLVAEGLHRVLTEENFPTKEALCIATDADYAELKAANMGRSTGSTLVIPHSILTLERRKEVLWPQAIYTPETFPSYEFLKEHNVQYLNKGAYSWLKDHYLGRPIPLKRSKFGGYYIKNGMEWPQAFIAHALRYETCSADEFDDFDEQGRMADSAKHLMTDDRFPSFDSLHRIGTKGLTNDRYERVRNDYVGTYFPVQDVREQVKDLVELYSDIDEAEGKRRSGRVY
jgi:hypothetical protein